MDLEKLYSRFKNPLLILTKSGKKVECTYDHSGKGYFNYRQLKNIKLTNAIVVRGMGKGFGNLRTEQIIKPKYFNIVATLIKNITIFLRCHKIYLH